MQKKNGAKQKNHMNPNGDQFLTKLPYDVTTLIISQLTLIERVQCIQVCKCWRTTFLENPYMWRTITDSDVLPDLVAYDINGKDIRHLFMRYGRTDALKYLVDLGCSNMQTIANVYYSPLLQELLDLTSHSLTRLELDVVSNVDMGDFLCDLFTACPNLTHLRCTYNRLYAISKITQSAAKLATESPATESMSRVVDLNLTLPAMDTPQLKRILSFFTGVRHIYLQEPFDADQILDWIDATLPLLQTIRLGKDSLPCQPANCGRKALSYHQDCVKQKSAESMLKKYTPIMSDFLVQTDLGMEPVYCMIQRFISQGTPHLRSLAIQSRRLLIRVPPLSDIEQLLCQFPCLEDLVLESVDLGAKCQMTLETPEPRLKNVKLIHCNGVTATKLATLISCFCYHMDSVCFVGVDELPDQVLDVFDGRVCVLRQLAVSSKDLNNIQVRKIVDIWSKRQLGSLHIFGLNRVISPRALITYAHQKLPKTKIDIGSSISDFYRRTSRPAFSSF